MQDNGKGYLEPFSAVLFWMYDLPPAGIRFRKGVRISISGVVRQKSLDIFSA